MQKAKDLLCFKAQWHKGPAGFETLPNMWAFGLPLYFPGNNISEKNSKSLLKVVFQKSKEKNTTGGPRIS